MGTMGGERVRDSTCLPSLPMLESSKMAIAALSLTFSHVLHARNRFSPSKMTIVRSRSSGAKPLRTSGTSCDPSPVSSLTRGAILRSAFDT